MTKKSPAEKAFEGLMAFLSAIDGNRDPNQKPGGFAFLIFLILAPIVFLWPLVLVGLVLEQLFGFWVALIAGIAAQWWYIAAND